MSAEPVLGLLRALCSGLAAGGITVVADDTQTAFAPLRRQITIAKRFLAADTPVAIGALLHEVGHALVTRYHLFAEPKDGPAGLWWQALNAIEENRVHRFIRRRLPGAGRYLEALFAVDAAPGPEAFESDLVVWLAAAATWDRHPGLPFLDGFPEAAAAFYRTEAARLRYTRCLPPPDLMAQPGLDQRYEESVVPALEIMNGETVVPLEAEVRCAAAGGLRICRNEIWPEILALAARDQARIARSMADDASLAAAARAVPRDGPRAAAERAVLARRALRAWIKAHGTAAAPHPPTDGEHAKLAWELLRQYLEAQWPMGQYRRSPLRIPGRVDDEDKPDGAVDDDGASGDREPATADGNESARAALVEVLRQALPRRRERPLSGFRSGRSIDLDCAMRAVATGRDGERIWVRRVPDRPALAALLLVDLSGSMNGQGKIEAAIAATRVLSAAMAEVRRISWSVLGFQDVTIPFVRFGERMDARVLARIDEMAAEVTGKRPDGNNKPRYNDDGPCLLEAAACLRRRPEQHGLLVVISDGNPEGRRSTRDDLHRAVAEVQTMSGMKLVGLGLGPSTEHVTRYYPVSQANIALCDLAPTIGRLLAARLQAAG